MNLHGKIMNIPINEDGKSIAREAITDSGVHIAYKIGHRDARHEAAEMAIKTDRLMEDMAGELTEFLEWVKMGDYDQSFVEKAEMILEEYEQWRTQ